MRTQSAPFGAAERVKFTVSGLDYRTLQYSERINRTDSELPRGSRRLVRRSRNTAAPADGVLLKLLVELLDDAQEGCSG